MSKRCSNKSCPEINPQPEERFYKDGRAKDGLQRMCITCTKENNRRAWANRNNPKAKEIADAMKVKALVAALPENKFHMEAAYKQVTGTKSDACVHEFLAKLKGEPLRVLKAAITDNRYMSMVLKYLDGAAESDDLIRQERAIAVWLKLVEVLGNKLGMESDSTNDQSAREELMQAILSKHNELTRKGDDDAPKLDA